MSIVDLYDKMHDVAKLHMKGFNPTEISRELDLKRTDVIKYIGDWQEWIRKMAESSQDVKDRVMDILFESDQHYALVIKESWDTVEEAKLNSELGNKTQALKLIAQITKDRVSMFQAAGLNQDTELAEQLQRTEHQQEVLKEILRDVTAHCENCKIEVRKRLSEISSEAEVIEIERTDT